MRKKRIITDVNAFRTHKLFESNDKEAMIENFLNALVEVVQSMPRGDISYSYIAAENAPYSQHSLYRSSGRFDNGGERYEKQDSDPDQDFKIMKDKLAENGWSSEAVNDLFARHGDKIATMHKKEETPSELWGAYGDLFLYKMTDGKALLMGYNTKKDQSADEHFFKYRYGYMKSKYGRLALAQHFGSLDKYLDELGKGMQKFLGMDWDESDGGLGYGEKALIEFMHDSWGVSSMKKNYKYDSATNVAVLDFEDTPGDLDDQEIVSAAGQYTEDKTFRQLVLDWLMLLGFPEKSQKSSQDIETGGWCEIVDGENKVKIHFDGE